jgi:hypothetical protein
MGNKNLSNRVCYRMYDVIYKLCKFQCTIMITEFIAIF